MKLSSGIARIPEMLKLGVTVGLGVDGSASNDGSSLLEEMRVAYLLHRLNSGAAAPTGYDILKMATVGSAKLLGRDDIGSIEEGKCADMFMVDSRRIELAGACYDPGCVLCTVGVRGSRGLYYSQRQNNRKGGPPCEYRRGKALGRRR